MGLTEAQAIERYGEAEVADPVTSLVNTLALSLTPTLTR